MIQKYIIQKFRTFHSYYYLHFEAYVTNQLEFEQNGFYAFVFLGQILLSIYLCLRYRKNSISDTSNFFFVQIFGIFHIKRFGYHFSDRALRFQAYIDCLKMWAWLDDSFDWCMYHRPIKTQPIKTRSYLRNITEF